MFEPKAVSEENLYPRPVPMQPAQKKFLIRFVVVLGAFYLLVAIQPVNDRVVVPFTELLVRVSTALLAALGERTQSFGTVIQSPAFAVDVKNGCNGIEAALLLVAAMLAFPARARQRMLGIAAGLALIQGVNLFPHRLAVLARRAPSRRLRPVSRGGLADGSHPARGRDLPRLEPARGRRRPS